MADKTYYTQGGYIPIGAYRPSTSNLGESVAQTGNVYDYMRPEESEILQVSESMPKSIATDYSGMTDRPYAQPISMVTPSTPIGGPSANTRQPTIISGDWVEDVSPTDIGSTVAQTLTDTSGLGVGGGATAVSDSAGLSKGIAGGSMAASFIGEQLLKADIAGDGEIGTLGIAGQGLAMAGMGAGLGAMGGPAGAAIGGAVGGAIGLGTAFWAKKEQDEAKRDLERARQAEKKRLFNEDRMYQLKNQKRLDLQKKYGEEYAQSQLDALEYNEKKQQAENRTSRYNKLVDVLNKSRATGVATAGGVI